MRYTSARQAPCEVPSGSPSRDKTHSGSVTETGEASFKSRDFDVRPLLVIWEMTQACDLKCVHCRASAQPHRHALELSTVEAFNLVDQVANMRVPMFVLTGGDPLKRPDLQAIVQYARGRSVKTSLTPSATPLFTRLHEIPALPSNHPVFLCMNNQDADGRIRSRDILVQRRLCVLPRVEPQAEERKIVTRRGANFRRVFADPCGEYESINPAQHGNHGTNSRSQAVDINIKRQFCAFMAVLTGGKNFPHIAGNSRYPEQPRFLIEDLVKLLAGELSLSHQVGKNARIHGARPGAHHETLQRGKTHRCVDASTLENRRQRTAIPQMASHEFQGIQVLAQQLCGTLCAILMIDPVESITANPLLEPIVRTGIRCRRQRHLAMEAGVKDRDLRHWAQQFRDDLHAFQFGAIVEGGKNGNAFDRRLDLSSDDRGL